MIVIIDYYIYLDMQLKIYLYIIEGGELRIVEHDFSIAYTCKFSRVGF